MKIISVLNYKGGVGKSTIVTNLASYFANRGEKVLVGDFTTQQSVSNWLKLRPHNAAIISSWGARDNKAATPAKDTDYIIVDSTFGIKDSALKKIVGISDKVIVPLKSSICDIVATQSFLEELVGIINEQTKETDVCLVGSMVYPKTRTHEQLQQFLNGTGLDTATSIANNQLYVHLMDNGLSLFDSKGSLFEKEIREEWFPLLKWVLKPI